MNTQARARTMLLNNSTERIPSTSQNSYLSEMAKALPSIPALATSCFTLSIAGTCSVGPENKGCWNSILNMTKAGKSFSTHDGLALFSK